MTTMHALVSISAPLPARRADPSPPPVAAAGPAAPSRLAVLQDGAQDCSRCRCLDECWTKNSPRDDAITVNLLVCRIQRGIAREASTRLLLGLLRPKLRKIARDVSRRVRVPFEEAYADASQVLVVSVMTRYVFGEHAPALVYLFDARYGALTRWAYHQARAATLSRSRFVSYGGTLSEREEGGDFERRLRFLNAAVTDQQVQSGPPVPVVDADEASDTDQLARLTETIEDGRTLSVREYRVLRFCLVNAEAGGALKEYLAARLGVARSVVTRLYGLAFRRLVDGAGLRGQYLAARDMPAGRRVGGRVGRRVGGRALSGREVAEIVTSSATSLDLAYAYGTNDNTVRKLRRRYKGMSSVDIEQAVEQGL